MFFIGSVDAKQWWFAHEQRVQKHSVLAIWSRTGSGTVFFVALESIECKPPGAAEWNTAYDLVLGATPGTKFEIP